MSDVIDAGQQNPATPSDQPTTAEAVITDGQAAVSQGEQPQTVQVPDGKTGISPAQARSLEGAEGFIPENFVVVEEQKAAQADDAPVVPDPIEAEPTGEPQEPTTAEAITEADFYGIPYQIVDGKPQVFMKVEGTEQYIDLKRVIDGFNFNARNQRVAQELAKERKEIENLRETMMMIDQFAPQQPQAPAQDPADPYGDLFDVEGDLPPAAPAAPPAAPAPVTPPAPEPQAQDTAVMSQLTNAYTDLKTLCEETGTFFPPEAEDGSNPTLVGAIQAEAENRGIDPIALGSSSVQMLKLLKRKYRKVEQPTGQPDALPTGKPPVTQSVKKATPEPSELISARAQLAELKEENMNVDADHDNLNAEIIALTRRIKILEGS